MQRIKVKCCHEHPLQWVLLAVVATTPVLADVGPPIKVVVPPERLIAAISGEEYSGAIEVRAGEIGLLNDVSLSGEGWDITLHTGVRPIEMQGGTSYLIEFTGVPEDASKPLMFRATFEGRKVFKRIDLSQELLAKAGKTAKVAGVDAHGRLAPISVQLERGQTNTAGGQVIRFRGNIAYLRPQAMGGPQTVEVGVDNVWYEIVDEDDISDEMIYAGLTDQNGNFDVTVNWDDCDITGCDEPDIYLRWETDNGVLAVQRSDILEEDYSWSTEDDVLNDFEGSEVNFGTVMPGDLSQHPALHIHNSITRAFRFVLVEAGVAIDRVEAQWPESENGAFYTSAFEEIHIGPNEQWNEGTIIHEYGHHVLETQSQNVSPDYCNDFCDGEAVCSSGDDCEDEGHCTWCPETDHDAWNEGWPDWFGGAVIRTFAAEYGQAALSLNDGRYNVESLGTCCQDGMSYSATITQGYITALLQDIEDGSGDDHSGGTYDCTGVITPLDCVADAMALGPEEIFAVAIQNDAITPLQFIQEFRNRFPQWDQDLWSTATNVSPAFSFSVPDPEVQTQTLECKVSMAGDPMTLDASGNGSRLRYQWQRFVVDVEDGPDISGSQCPQLLFDPLSPAHAGVYRAVVSTCDQSSFTYSQPIRVSVLPARGDGTNGGSWGRNDGGQLGRGVFEPIGHQSPSGVPAPMVALSDAISISQGGESWHKLAVKSNGDVWGWGFNDSGQLGKDPAVVYFTHTPFLIEGLSNIVQTTSGTTFSMALRADGKVFSWGDNDYGTRGDGTSYGYNPAINQVGNLDCVVSIAAGSLHAAAVKSDGTVWTWGYGLYGQLGFDSDSFPLRSVFTPTEVPGINDAVAVAAGGYHTLVLRSNGTVLAFGRNSEGQLGDGTLNGRFAPMTVAGLTNVSAVRAGVFHSLVILQDGTVRAWGNNGGTLGNGLLDRALTPVQPSDIGAVLDVAGGYYHTIFLRADKTVWVSGWNVYGELGPRPYPEPLKPLPVAGINNAIAIGAGAGTSFAISSGVGPHIWQQPQNRTALVGQSTSFHAQHFGTPTFTYQWSRDGNDLFDGNGVSGANTPSLTLNPVSSAMAGTYRLRIDNLYGFTLSAVATLTVTCPNGDGNCDGVIDQADVVGLADCLNGPFGPRPAICNQALFAIFDANNDNDVDLPDAAILQNCFAGDEFIDPACGQ